MPRKKSKTKIYKRLRGFRDVLPQDQAYWDHVFGVVREVAAEYRYSRMILPVLEETTLFKRSIGTDTDVVGKEMYTFLDPGERSVSLRPEFTAGMARAYIEHGLFNQPNPIKLFDVGPLFRHDNPQAGRFRQFWQFNFEVFGEHDSVVDAQVIHMAQMMYQKMGLPVTILINSLGCRDCREKYIEALIKALKSKRSKMCDDCKKRLTRNPLRLLDCKEEACREITEGAPHIIDHLCEECKNHFMMVLEYLDDLEVTYDLSPRLVRGLDYYSHTAFEIALQDGSDGSQAALGGGGRYDYLIEDIGGRPTPGIGFAGGIDRIVDALKQSEYALPKVNTPEVFVAQLGVDARKAAFRVFSDLQSAGVRVAESFSKTGLKQQLEYANRAGSNITLILGQKELNDKTIIIRDMESGIQETVDIQKVVSEVRKRIDAIDG